MPNDAVMIDVERELAAWRASHALGPLAELDFDRDVAPLLKAALDAYLASPGDEEKMRENFARHREWIIGSRASKEQAERIAADCWEDFRKAGRQR